MATRQPKRGEKPAAKQSHGRQSAGKAKASKSSAGSRSSDGTRTAKKQTPKKKATAHGRAAERMSSEGKRPDEVRTPTSEKHESQSRFAGETPLTGEDRPIDGAGKKQEGPDQPIPGLEPSDQAHFDEGQPLSARKESSLKRKQAGSAGTPSGRIPR